MSNEPSGFPGDPVYAGLDAVRRNWGWFLVLGIIIVLAGIVAISSAVIATLAGVVILGTLALIGAGAQLVAAIFSRRWGGFFLHVLIGLLYLVMGFLIIQHPLAAAAGLTLLLALAFLVGGLFRIIFALSERFPNWGWVLLNGIITLVLGILIWRHWPEDALWVIGLFIGIDLLFNGWSLVMLGLAAKSLPTVRGS
jgi:uncharacterized membrane protein HdeD (DUF308 family)